MRRGRQRGTSSWWVLPALVPTLVVLVGGIGLALAQSVGIVPVFGRARPSLDAYRDVLSSGDLAPSIVVSLAISAASTALAAAVGLAAGLAVHRPGRGRHTVGAAAAATVPVPHLVGAAAMGLLLADSGLLARIVGAEPGAFPALVAGPTWAAVVLEYAWKESAFVAVVVVAVLRSRVARYDEPAAVLGASPGQRFRAVTLPLLAPALIVTAIITFVYTLGSYEVAWLLGRASPQPLPVLAYQLFTSSDLTVRPQALAVAMTTAVIATAAIAVGLVLLRRVSTPRGIDSRPTRTRPAPTDEPGAMAVLAGTSS